MYNWQDANIFPQAQVSAVVLLDNFFCYCFSYTKKESDLHASQIHVKDLESALHSKEASLQTALGGKEALEEEVEDLQARLSKVTLIKGQLIFF